MITGLRGNRPQLCGRTEICRPHLSNTYSQNNSDHMIYRGNNTVTSRLNLNRLNNNSLRLNARTNRFYLNTIRYHLNDLRLTIPTVGITLKGDTTVSRDLNAKRLFGRGIMLDNRPLRFPLLFRGFDPDSLRLDLEGTNFNRRHLRVHHPFNRLRTN